MGTGESRAPYRRVADDLRAAIAGGALEPGAKVPSGRELAGRYGITHVTAERALGLLRAEGLLEVRPGLGTYVREARPMVHVSIRYLTGGATWQSEAAGQGMNGTQELEQVGALAPSATSPSVAAHLGDAVVVRRRRMLLDGVPVQLASSFYPLELAEGTELARPAPMPGGTIAALARVGAAPVRFHEVWSFRMPTPHERGDLNLADGVPVAELVRVSYARLVGEPGGDLAVSVDVTVMAGDRHRIVNDYRA